jgi:hypothetical protein
MGGRGGGSFFVVVSNGKRARYRLRLLTALPAQMPKPMPKMAKAAVKASEAFRSPKLPE